jgi:hypothetical protein
MMVLILGVLSGWVVLSILIGMSLARTIALRERQLARALHSRRSRHPRALAA